MQNCDVCDSPTTWENGTAYTTDEFRQLVAKGFGPSEAMVARMALFGISREQAIAQWKHGLVAQSTTDWLLCPTCAARAAHYMPKTAGTGPAGHKLVEPLTKAMLEPVIPEPESLPDDTDELAAPAVTPSGSFVTPEGPVEPGGASEKIGADTKKCPMCAEIIQKEARVCRYCGARFIVLTKGYCSHCHLLVEADENGRCCTCGTTLIDLRAESSLLENQGTITNLPDQGVMPSPGQELQAFPRKGEGVSFRFGPTLVDMLVVGLIASALLLVFPSLSDRALPAVGEWGNWVSLSSLLSIWIAGLLYFTLLEGSTGITLGKWLSSLRVVRLDGSRAGHGRAAVRGLFWPLEANIIGAIFIWATSRNQRLGDLLAGTLVVNRKKLHRITLKQNDAVYEFLDGRCWETDKLMGGEVHKYLRLKDLKLTLVTRDGKWKRLTLPLHSLPNGETLRRELERFYQVGFIEKVQWWRLVAGLAVLILLVPILIFAFSDLPPIPSNLTLFGGSGPTPRPGVTRSPAGAEVAATPTSRPTSRSTRTPTPLPAVVDFDTLYEQAIWDKVVIIGYLDLPGGTLCDTDCGVFLEDPRDRGDQISVFLDIPPEGGTPAPNQMARLPDPYLPSDFQVRLDDGSYIGEGALVKLTGWVCETTEGEICVSNIVRIELAEASSQSTVPEPQTQATQPPQSSSDCGGETKVRVENMTGDPVTLYLSGPCNYTFNLSTGVQRIAVKQGVYTVTISMCGGLQSSSHVINPTWKLTLKCP